MSVQAVRLMIAASVGAAIAFTIGLPFTLIAKAFLDIAVDSALAATSPGSPEYSLISALPPIFYVSGVLAVGYAAVTWIEQHIRF